MGWMSRTSGESDFQDGIWLFCDHTFGRDPRCSTALASHAVSRFHARLSWNGREWTLRDLGSRNGTYHNGRRVAEGKIVVLRENDRVAFGDFTEEYVLSQSDPPRSLLLVRNATRRSDRLPLSSVLPLPSPDRPLCTLFVGALGEISLERESGEVQPLVHGSRFQVEDTHYQVVLADRPGEHPQTGSSKLDPIQDTFCLEIGVAPDEESAEVLLRKGNERRSYAPKTHFYLLAHLARIRLAHDDTEMAGPRDENEHGWVDCEALCKDLRINREHLAQQVFRIRQELKADAPALAETILDRRLRGRMRIGLPPRQVSIRTME